MGASRGTPDGIAAQMYGSSAFSGTGSKDMGAGAGYGKSLPSSGSFVAAPFEEGAPTLDMLTPPAAYGGAYSHPPPAAPGGLQSSGSFVATPYAEGAPDMFAMSREILRCEGELPGRRGAGMDAYPSSPPASLYGAPKTGPAGFGNMTAAGNLGGMPMDASAAMGFSNIGFGSGYNPFAGFGADFPGGPTGPASLGAAPEAGSFVAMAPPAASGKENSAGVRFSDTKSDCPGADAKQNRRSELGKEEGPPKPKSRMDADGKSASRSSRSREPLKTRKRAERS